MTPSAVSGGRNLMGGYMQLQQVFCKAEEIAVYNDGVSTSYACGERQYEEICVKWSELLTDSIVMPAFGVSINDMTVQGKQKGVWVEFSFSKQLKVNELPFEKLLVEVRSEYKGFNVIRYNSDSGYFGRCFYIDLRENDMSSFYSFIREIC